MALTVNTNMASVDAINQLSSSTRKLAGSFERVASGLRINKALMTLQAWVWLKTSTQRRDLPARRCGTPTTASAFSIPLRALPVR